MHFLRNHRSAVSASAVFFMVARLLVVVASAALIVAHDPAPAVADPTPGICYTVPDSGGANGGDDLLTLVDRLDFDPATNETNAGTGTGTTGIEAIAMSPLEVLYAADRGQLGIIDTDSASGTYGEYDSAGFVPFGSGTGSAGTITFSDVDGLTFDPFTGYLYGASRRTDDDALIVIDPSTGAAVQDAFGSGVDYVLMPAVSGLDDVDDIAIDPIDGTLFGIMNNGGSGDRLVIINKATGATTDLGVIGPNDMEGFGFSDDGTLWGVDGSYPYALWEVDKTGATAPNLAANPRPLDNGADYESVECIETGINTISGTVFADGDQDGSYGPGDLPDPGAIVRLYRDADGDGQVGAGDTLLTTLTTAADGTYSFEVSSKGDYVLNVDTASLPPGHAMTTDNVETASFSSMGFSDPGNDFGWFLASDLTITKAVDPTGEVGPGQVLTYTVTVRNSDSVNHTNVTVTDAVPAGTTYVADSTSISAPLTTGGTYRDEFNSISYAGNNGSLSWTSGWVEEGETTDRDGGEIRVRADTDVDPDREYAVLTKKKDRAMLREADLSGLSSATLSFDLRRKKVKEGVLIVEMAPSASGPWTQIAAFTGADPVGGIGTEDLEETDYTTYSYALDGYPTLFNANANVRFRHTNKDNEFWIDNVEIDAQQRTVTTFAGDAPPTVASGLDLQPGEEAIVAFQVVVDALPGTPVIDNLASVVSNESPLPATASASNDVAVSINVTKDASPTSVPEHGGDVTYTVQVENTSGIAVTISDLDDDRFGDLLDGSNPDVSNNTCSSMSLVVPPGDTRACTFDASLSGVPLTSHVNIVVATAGNPGHASDTDRDAARVAFSDVPPTVTLDKWASPTTLPEPGGDFVFTLDITNTSAEAVTITTLVDSQSPFFSKECVDLVGSSLAAGASTSCSYTVNHTNAGTYVNKAEVTVEDDDGSTGSAGDTETVTVTDVAPTVTLDKSASPTTLPEPGGNFTFTIDITNTSTESVTIAALDDTQSAFFSQECLDLVGSSLAAGVSTSCSYTVNHTNAGTYPNTASVTVEDDEGGTASAEDNESVTVTDVAPTVVLVKSVSPGTLPEPGGDFVFTLDVTNTSFETVAVTGLSDSELLVLSASCAALLGSSLAPDASASCTYTVAYTNAGVYPNTASVTVRDLDGSEGTDTDSVSVSVTDVTPSLSVDKSVSPTSLPESGGLVTYTVVVTNPSVEPVTLTSLVDDRFGDLAGQGDCVTGGSIPAGGGTYSCTFTKTLSSPDLSAHTNTVTAAGQDDEGNATPDASDDATVSFTNVAPQITVDKTVSPTSVPESGGLASFTVVVTNDSTLEPVTVTSLVDDMFGDLLDGSNTAVSDNTCLSIDVVIPATESRSCTFDASLSGNAGSTHTNTVTATATDGDPGSSPVTDSDDAVVTFSDVAPTVVLVKSVSPTTLPETGGPVTFTLGTTNNSTFEAVTVTSLVDDRFGDLLGADTSLTGGATATSCNDALPTTIAAGETWTCTIEAALAGDAGDTHTNTATVTATDGDPGSTPVTDSDSATVTFTDEVPEIVVTKTANPMSVPESGGPVVYTVDIENPSLESVTVTDLVDNRFGDLLGGDAGLTGGATATSCNDALPITIAAGATFVCTIDATLSGHEGVTHTNTVTVTATDGDPGSAPVSNSDSATVSFTDVAPTVTLDKSALPTTLPEPGGDFVFTLDITNTSFEAVTITALTDTQSTFFTQDCIDLVGTSLAPAASASCSYTVPHTNAGSYDNTASVTVRDNDGTEGSDTAEATVTVTDVAPTVTLDKTALPTTLPEPGGDFVFTLDVTNTSFEAVTITALTDTQSTFFTQDCIDLVGTSLAPAASASCSYTVPHTNAGSYDNTASVTVADDEGTTATDTAEATVTVTDVDPDIQVTKTASPSLVPETGADVTFTFLVENIGVEDVTLTSLTDTVLGDLEGRGSCATGGSIPVAGSYSCSLTVFLASDDLSAHSNVVTAIAADDDGGTDIDFDGELVEFTNVNPTIVVTKTADPTSVREPGGDVTYTIAIENTSLESVTVTSLVDDRFGNLLGSGGLIGGATSTSCNDSSPISIGAGGTFTCTIDATLLGVEGGTHTNVVTATATDGDVGSTPVTDSDNAVVTFIHSGLPSVAVTKTANPTSLSEPGGSAVFTVEIENTSRESVVVTSLVDDRFGNLLDPDSSLTGGASATSCNNSLPIAIDEAGTFTCTIDAALTGDAGDLHTNTVSATVEDADSNEATGTDGATVTFSDVLPSIVVTKTADPTTLLEPGGDVTYTVSIENTSVESVTVTTLTDDRFGNLLGLDENLLGGASATSCNETLPIGIAAGDTFSCTIDATLAGDAGETHDNIVSVTAIDNEDNPATDDGTATVTFSNSDPTIVVTKAPAPAVVPETGGAVVFTVVVENTSPDEAVTITDLSDDRFGNLLGLDEDLTGGATATSCNDNSQAPIAAGEAFTCTISATLSGDVGTTHRNVVTATAVDGDTGSTPATDSDDADVTFTDVPPNIGVTKTPSAGSVDEPGGTVSFAVVVANLSDEAVTLDSLIDSEFGNLLNASNGAVTANTCATEPRSIPVGGSFTCSFDADLVGTAAGLDHENTVRAVASDNEGTPAEDDDSATVRFDDVLPTISVDKTVNPGSLPEPGGTATFSVAVVNTSSEPITLDALGDSVFGDLLNASNGAVIANTCAIEPRLIPVSGSFDCTFDADLVADAAGDDHLDVVTADASDDEGNTTSESDDASVVYTDVLPTISITKTPSNGSIPEPGGPVSFAISIPNTSTESVVVDAIGDSDFGNLLDPSNPAVSSNTCPTQLRTLPIGGTLDCTFDAIVSGDASGVDHVNTATAEAHDNEGNTASASDDAIVEFTDALPNVDVTKTPSVGSVAEPGDTVTFSVAVANAVGEAVTLTALVDDVFGNLLDVGNGAVSANTCPAEPTAIPVGGSFTCAFDAFVAGNFGDPAHVNTVEATVVDNETNPVSDDDSATVTYSDAQPSIDVSKNVTPGSLAEPGGAATFTVEVANTSVEPLTLDALNDNVFGNLLDGGNGAVFANTCPTQTTAIAVDGTFTCTFAASLVGDASGPDHVNVVTAEASDDDSNPVTNTDGATVVFDDVLPTITTMKTPSPGSVSEPGGVVTFTVSVRNTSPEPVTLIDLVDDVFGDLLDVSNVDVSNNTCPAQPTAIPVGTTVTCSFDAFLAGNNGDAAHVNTVTAIVEDDDLNSANDDDSAGVAFGDAPPTIDVTKAANPGSVPESGAIVTFSVSVANTGVEGLTLTALGDDQFGDLLDGANPLLSANSCATQSTAIAVGGSFTCSFDAFVAGDASGSNHVNTVSAAAEDDDNNTVAGDDSAVVVITDVPPSIATTKNASAADVPEPGATVTFSVSVRNTSAESVTLTALTDDVFGNLLDGSNPLLLANSCPAQPTAMATDAVFTCSFDAFVPGSFGDADHVDIVTATVRDNDGTERSDDDTATVGFNDAHPNISVAKSATPAAVGEPGDTVTFTVEVTNSSVEAVTLTSLTDDVFGDLLNGGNPLLSANTCPAQATTIPVGGTLTCAFDAFVSGNFGDTAHMDTVTAEVQDDDGNSIEDDDSATVTFLDLLPLIDVSKTPSVGSLPEPGGTVVFTVVIDNTGPEPVTVTALSDTVFGDLLDPTNLGITANTCATVPLSILVNGSLTCTFSAAIVGDASGPNHENTVNAAAQDDEGNTTGSEDLATVSFTDVLPTSSVTKTPNVGTVPEPGAPVTFAVSVANTAPEALTLESLTDDVFGDLLDPANPAVTANSCPTQPTTIPVGGTLTCAFEGLVVGDASGPDHENTVTAGLSDDDANSVTADDTATVTFDDALPNISVTKTPSASAVTEPGEIVTFDIAVDASAAEALTLTSLVDDVFGDLLDPANPSISDNTCATASTAIPAGGTFTCAFDGFVSGSFGGADHVNTVGASARDNEGNPTTGDDSATVVFNDYVPSVLVAKSASVASVDEPGETVTFSVTVTNTGVRDVTLIDLVDDVYGDLLDGGNAAVDVNTCTAQPTAIAAGGTLTCSFDGFVSGNAAGPDHVNTVSGTVEDGDGDEASDDDPATVAIDDVPPVVTVDKTASAESVDESGDTVTFTVVVTNASAETVTLTDLTDDVFGDLLDDTNVLVSSNTCPAQPAAMTAGATVICTFDGYVSGDASGLDHENTVTATVVDDDGTTDEDDDSAVVSFEDAPPSIVVEKSATVTAVEAPGERVTFIVEITNDGGESVTITSLIDDVYGDLLDPGNAAVSNNVCPLQPAATAVGATFRCTFDAFVGGDANGPDHVNTVTAIAVDNDGTTTDDGGTAVVEIDPLVPRASVSGHIWLDLIPNLEFDEVDPPFSGFTVRIYDAAGVEVGTAAVDGVGFYEFTELRPGDYTIVVEGGSVEAGYVVVLDPDGVNDLSTSFSLSASESLDLRDFAYRGVGEIGDTVWRDDNRNGVLDPGEPGIAGVGVELVWAGFDGVLGTADDYRYPKQFTDADGLYLFGELPPGAFAVAIDPVSGLTATTQTSYSINRTGSESFMSADAGFAIADSTSLPKTGADTDRLTRTGFLAIAFGAMLLLGAAVLGRRRDADDPFERE